MTKEQYQVFNFRGDTLRIIEQANAIIREFTKDGFDLTLRQLYYQFVARDLLKNCDASYDKLGTIVNNARLNGDIDWDAIKDRTRDMHENLHWDSPAQRMRYAARNYMIDTREDQENYIEVWVEKEALVGIVKRVSSQLDVPYFACRGYVSQTAMYDAAERIKDMRRLGRRATILHLGDHDPSGIDMTRDIRERLNDVFGAYVNVKRIALNMDQIKLYNPPPNPAKLTDSRCADYIKNYGNLSWELDALDPNTLTNLITEEVNALTDLQAQNNLYAKQLKERDLLIKCSDNWDSVLEHLEGIDD